MWIRCAILLVFLTILPFAFGRHIRSVNEDTTQTNAPQTTSGSSTTKKQLRKTHLRIHTKPPKTLQVQEGDNEFLECQAGGTPAPAIHWLKDGTVIPQGQTSEEYHQKSPSSNDVVNGKGKINVSFTTARLYLDCMSVEDEGDYTCVAENPYQRISTSTKLTVSSSDEEIECGKKSHGQAPRITFWTKTMIASQRGEAKFACRADGYPRPTIRWLGLKDEELSIADFSKYEVLSDGDLVIRNLSWSDLGTYSCIAENVHGESKVEVFLYPSIENE